MAGGREGLDKPVMLVFQSLSSNTDGRQDMDSYKQGGLLLLSVRLQLPRG